MKSHKVSNSEPEKNFFLLAAVTFGDGGTGRRKSSLTIGGIQQFMGANSLHGGKESRIMQLMRIKEFNPPMNHWWCSGKILSLKNIKLRRDHLSVKVLCNVYSVKHDFEKNEEETGTKNQICNAIELTFRLSMKRNKHREQCPLVNGRSEKG